MKILKVSDLAYKELLKKKESAGKKVGRSVTFSEIIEQLLGNKNG